MSWNDYIYYTATITPSWILLYYKKHSTHYTMFQQLQAFYTLKKEITNILHSKKKISNILHVILHKLQAFYTLKNILH